MMPTTNCDPSNPPLATRAIQPETLIQPVIHESRGTYRFQDITATQWYLECSTAVLQWRFVTYWPPAVGYADRNSASDAARHRLHIPAVMRPQVTLVEPPDESARDSDAERAVQEFRIAKANPNMERKEKFLCSSPLWPKASS